MKKNCDICGEKIGLLGNRKLDDGNLCKNCASKLSPWFEERRHSTVEDIKRQLEYREKNKNAVRSFSITREFSADRYHVFIDDNKGLFAVAFNMSEQDNPDIVPLSAITSCRLDIDEQRVEEEYKDQDGESRSYVPPRYNYSYDYKIKLTIMAKSVKGTQTEKNLLTSFAGESLLLCSFSFLFQTAILKPLLLSSASASYLSRY